MNASDGPNPVLAELVRGTLVESRHRGAFAVVDATGRVVLSAGDIARPVYPRSAVKPIQAIPLVETGAAEAYALGDAELALACASHSGEARHVAAVTAWLARLGLTPDDLECGASLPADETALRRLYAAGGKAGPVYDNCSGKHAGFLTTARHLGQATEGYIRLDHPVQSRVRGVLEEMTGCDLAAAPHGTDGCGIPVFAVPLGKLARAMARFADPADQPAARRAACARLARAMAAEPFMVAGSGRFCTRVIAACGTRALVKTGAEGVYCAALGGRGLGIALKIDDGAGRAAEVAIGALLRRLGVLDAAAERALGDALTPVVRTRAGRPAGRLRPGPGCPA